jgi:hypothetical protein
MRIFRRVIMPFVPIGEPRGQKLAPVPGKSLPLKRRRHHRSGGSNAPGPKPVPYPLYPFSYGIDVYSDARAVNRRPRSWRDTALGFLKGLDAPFRFKLKECAKGDACDPVIATAWATNNNAVVLSWGKVLRLGFANWAPHYQPLRSASNAILSRRSQRWLGVLPETSCVSASAQSPSAR